MQIIRRSKRRETPDHVLQEFDSRIFSSQSLKKVRQSLKERGLPTPLPTNVPPPKIINLFPFNCCSGCLSVNSAENKPRKEKVHRSSICCCQGYPPRLRLSRPTTSLATRPARNPWTRHPMSNCLLGRFLKQWVSTMSKNYFLHVVKLLRLASFTTTSMFIKDVPLSSWSIKMPWKRSNIFTISNNLTLWVIACVLSLVLIRKR